jgi:hypothetical protein
MTPRLTSRRYRFLHAALLCVLVALFFAASTALGLNGRMNEGGRYMDALGICSFDPPDGWVLWDYYGLDVFSPRENKDVRLSLVAEESDCGELFSEVSEEETGADAPEFSSPFLEKEEKEWRNTFSEPDFELISLETRELAGYPGMEVCARTTEDNSLFSESIIRIVRFYTPTHTVTMTLFCPEAALDEYREVVDTTIESITLGLPPGDDVSSR